MPSKLMEILWPAAFHGRDRLILEGTPGLPAALRPTSIRDCAGGHPQTLPGGAGQSNLIPAKKATPPDSASHPGAFLFGVRSALEAGVGLAVVEQIPDAVHGVLEDRGGGKHDHADRGINEWNDIEGGDKTGDLADEAEVFECFHGDRGAVSTASEPVDVTSGCYFDQNV